jgi:hypothetical protein
MKCLLILLCLVSTQAFSWGATGHLVINEIAYQHLTPTARTKVDQLVKTFAQTYPRFNNFLIDGDWPDYLRQTGVNAFNNWHYINQALSYDTKSDLPRYPNTNVVWAILQSEQVLSSQAAEPFSRAMFLMFLTHFVADAHQPLHCAVLYSKQFPQGDQGGNLYLIKNKFAPNLHSYWDQGADFYWQNRHSNKLSTDGIAQLANKIEQDYPESYFTARATDLDPTHWVHESFLLAKNFAYQTGYNQSLSKSYQKQAQQIVEQQTALAGYRLANLLNQLLG